jgi:hypothetical protein
MWWPRLCVLLIYSMFIHLKDVFNPSLNFLYLAVIGRLLPSMMWHHVVCCIVPVLQRTCCPCHLILLFLPWWWRWHVCLKCWYTCNGLHSVSFAQKHFSYLWIVILYETDAAVRFCLLYGDTCVQQMYCREICTVTAMTTDWWHATSPVNGHGL